MLWKMQQKPYLWRHGILISILVVSFMIFVLRKAGVMSAEYDNQLSEQELAKFNNQFEVYAKNDNTFFDVLTVANLAYDINKKVSYDAEAGVTVRIYDGSNVKYSILPVETSEKSKFFEGDTSNGEQIYVYNAESSEFKDSENNPISMVAYYTERIQVQNSSEQKYKYLFECTGIGYNDITGKVKEMNFKIVQN